MTKQTAHRYLDQQANAELEALVRQAQRERPFGMRSFERLVRRIEPTVYRYCRYIVKDENLAEDACQNTLIRLYRALDKFEGRSAFTTWLYRVSYHECLKVLDKRKAHETRKEVERFDDMAPGTEPSVSHASIQEGLELKSMLEGLKEDEVSLLILKHVDGHTFEDIADIMTMSVSAVKMKLYRLQQRLQESHG